MYKKNGIVFGLTACLMTMSGCETDFNPGMAYQEIPVIFGLIDHEDSEYRVSITKSYLPESHSQPGFGDKPDIYFDTLAVYLELRFDPESPRWGEYGFDQWLRTYEPYGELIIRKEMHPKQIIDSVDGSFKKVYALPATEFVRFGLYGAGTFPDLFLRLVVFRPGSDIYSVASTRLCEVPYLMSPGRGASINLYNNTLEWAWDGKENYQEPRIMVHYEELRNGRWDKKLLTWDFSPYQVKVFTGDGGSKFNYYSGFPFTEAILQHVGGRIKDLPEVEARKFISYDLVVFNADPVFGKYLESDKIVSDQIGRPISNVNNGLGIFASTSKNGCYGFTLDRRSEDSLVRGKNTRHLKFVRW